MLDKSHINDINEVLTLLVRIGERALPVAWRVRETQGNIGFAVQEELLGSICGWLGEDAEVMLVRYGQPGQLVPAGRLGLPYSPQGQSYPEP